MIAVRFTVRGKVQGVFFRASARNEALKRGLRGYAKNLPDGCVEVLAYGEAVAVEEFENWLWEGPPASRVDDVARHEYDGDVPAGFIVC